MTPSTGVLVIGLLAALGCGPPSAQPVWPGGVAPYPRSAALGACVGAGEMLLFATAEGRALAIRLDDGERVWTAPVVGEVAHCDGDSVVVIERASGSLVVRVLEPDDARTRFEHRVPLPDWANRSNTSVEAWRERDGWGVTWEARTRWRGGYPPSEEEEREATRDASGALVVRPDGTSRPVSGAPVPRDRDATWDGRHRLVGEGERLRVVELASGETRATIDRASLHAGVLHVGELLVFVGIATERDPEGPEARVRSVHALRRDGTLAWHVELGRELVPEGVP